MSESKESDPDITKEAFKEAIDEAAAAVKDDNVSEDEDEGPEASTTEGAAAEAAKTKKKSKKSKVKKALGMEGGEKATPSGSGSTPASKLTTGMIEQLLEMNPSLKTEVEGMTPDQAAEALRKLNVSDLMTGLVCFY